MKLYSQKYKRYAMFCMGKRFYYIELNMINEMNAVMKIQQTLSWLQLRFTLIIGLSAVVVPILFHL